MSLTIEDRSRMDGKFVLDTESRRYPFLTAYPPAHGDNSSYAYLGYDAQDDLRALGKAILNAVEPEALVENQKDAEPEQQYNVAALVAAVASLEERVADLEAAAKDNEIKVGDLVRYTSKGILPGEVHKVTDVYSTGDIVRYRLAYTTGYMKGEQAHSGASRDQIEKVN